jgi:hypothetical protein
MTTDDITAGLDDVRARLAAIRPAIEARAPWPLADRFDHAPEASWGPPEVLGHLLEMVPYWHAGLSAVAAGSADGSPVAFGRVATDEGRLANIERLRTLEPAAAFDQLDAALAAFAATWAGWTATERARIGVHPSRGEISVADGAQRFLIGHIGEHIDQLDASVAAAPDGR